MPEQEPELIVLPELQTTPDAVPDVLGDAGKRALEAERAQRQQLQQQLKKFDGVDPDEYFRVRQ
jgi:predicted amidohydrolase